MPTYDYLCPKGHRFELFHGIKDDSPKKCPKCGARARRVPAGGSGVLFKGSGFYATDYRSSQYKERAKADRPGSGSTDKGGADKGGADKGGSSSGSSSSGSKGE
jgi:putative FmdB family regulatory protein